MFVAEKVLLLLVISLTGDTDLMLIHFTGLLAPFAIHVPCHILANISVFRNDRNTIIFMFSEISPTGKWYQWYDIPVKRSVNCSTKSIWKQPYPVAKRRRIASTVRTAGDFRANSRFAPNQCETVLLCNDVCHWLGASLESALNFIRLSCIAPTPCSFKNNSNEQNVMRVWQYNDVVATIPGWAGFFFF